MQLLTPASCLFFFMDTVNTSQSIKACVDELHKHFVKMLMPDYQYASLVAVLAKAGKTYCRRQGESMEIAELVHDEIYGHGLERWLQSVRKASPTGTLTEAEFESTMMDFDYMFRNGRTRPKAVSRQVTRKNSKKKQVTESGSAN
ncbi:hypothetical protein DBR42_06660 [Pelomonas sp. HMWF004]|nr:hypothetical protein DBR42_06660 [Pelomonas sp. HMWF004]